MKLTPAPPRADTSPVAKAAATGFVTVTHEILFADDGPRCDVCGDRIPDDEDPETALTGSGLYIWSRGGEIVYEEPPLCAVCGTAIGMSALARWEIEEEEGPPPPPAVEREASRRRFYPGSAVTKSGMPCSRAYFVTCSTFVSATSLVYVAATALPFL